MTITKTTVAVEIAILAAILVAVEWLATRLTHAWNWPALVIGWAIYLGVRLTIAARRRPS